MNNSHPLMKLLRSQLSPFSAWTSAMIAVSINILGNVLQLRILMLVPQAPWWPAIASSLAGIALLTVLLWRHGRASIKLSSLVYLVNAVSVIGSLLMTNPYFALYGKNWVPFQASKLACLISAMIAPSFLTGLLTIVAQAASSAIQFELFTEDLRDRIAVGEPWAMLAFAMVGIFTLSFRFRRVLIEEEMAQIRVKTLFMRQLAKSFLRLRDLMNTPLQIIEFSTDILRSKNLQDEAILVRIENAVESLKDLNAELTRYEKDSDWSLEGD